jgi:dynein heavy chain
MYQYSLQFFQLLFNRRLQLSEKNDNLDQRLIIVINDVTKAMYVNICRGLFEKDKLIYSFMIASNIARQDERLTAAEFKFWLVGAATEPKDSKALTPAMGEWMNPRTWFGLKALESVGKEFEGLQESVVESPSLWKTALAESEYPHDARLPGKWDTCLTNFQRILIVKVFREEKAVHAATTFVNREIGDGFTVSPPFDLEGAFNDSSSATPLIFVLSPGADVNDYLVQLAETKGKSVTDGTLKIISLGQGQGPIAERLMAQGRKRGDWVCLQNCHLAVSWLPRMEQDLEQAATSGDRIHDEFRLWLTSIPSEKFPVPVLQNGIKITNEPPRGIKANLSRTFADLSEEQYECCTKSKAFKKLLFGLAFYNALILERRKFGAVGWNIPYEWMNSDLKTAILQVRLYLEEQEDIPYETLNVMVADISYGGRITDKWVSIWMTLCHKNIYIFFFAIFF